MKEALLNVVTDLKLMVLIFVLSQAIAIAKTIAEIHKGALQVENLPEGGAKFSLILPLPKKAAL